MIEFPAKTGTPVMARTYLRKKSGNTLETPEEAIARSLQGRDGYLLTKEEKQLCLEYALKLWSLPAGRRLWYGGTPDSEKPNNVMGLYNCNSINPTELRLEIFREAFQNLMLGCGVGTVFERKAIAGLPPINNLLQVEIVKAIPNKGEWIREKAQEHTELMKILTGSLIIVGDSRKGWVDAYMNLIYLATAKAKDYPLIVQIDLSNVRPPSTPIKGFGGKANPQALPELFSRTAAILNQAIGRKLNSVECCLLTDIAAHTTVSGNVRRSAQIHQGSADDLNFAEVKSNLWQQDEDGNWRIDPDRDILRMANHTRVFHYKPTEQECINAVRKQYYSGEGAIQYAPEAIARANADILDTPELKQEFIEIYTSLKREETRDWLRKEAVGISDREIDHRLNRYGLNPCAEICGHNFACNLAEIHLNLLAESDKDTIRKAFQVAALNACRQLTHRFPNSELQYSRELDPIVGISVTGLFDFFVQKFGKKYLDWWASDRPVFLGTNNRAIAKAFREEEIQWLCKFRSWAEEAVFEFCDRHGLKRPNRFTTVQPAGTKSLLTGASPGWHPPKAVRFIRRITFRKNDPVALTCIDCGYSVIPSQSDKDENGHLLNDPFDPRCTEWLVEVPCEVSWADLADQVGFDPSQISALAQFDFAMQVQRHYVGHNTSATIELRENEIEPLGRRIHQAIDKNEGYISFALLSRFDDHQAFPRLPFEPISKETYDRLASTNSDPIFFKSRLEHHLQFQDFDHEGPAGCDSDKCFLEDLA